MLHAQGLVVQQAMAVAEDDSGIEKDQVRILRRAVAVVTVVAGQPLLADMHRVQAPTGGAEHRVAVVAEVAEAVLERALGLAVGDRIIRLQDRGERRTVRSPDALLVASVAARAVDVALRRVGLDEARHERVSAQGHQGMIRAVAGSDELLDVHRGSRAVAGDADRVGRLPVAARVGDLPGLGRVRRAGALGLDHVMRIVAVRAMGGVRHLGRDRQAPRKSGRDGGRKRVTRQRVMRSLVELRGDVRHRTGPVEHALGLRGGLPGGAPVAGEAGGLLRSDEHFRLRRAMADVAAAAAHRQHGQVAVRAPAERAGPGGAGRGQAAQDDQRRRRTAAG